jgi:hypothetical protein
LYTVVTVNLRRLVILKGVSLSFPPTLAILSIVYYRSFHLRDVISSLKKALLSIAYLNEIVDAQDKNCVRIHSESLTDWVNGFCHSYLWWAYLRLGFCFLNSHGTEIPQAMINTAFPLFLRAKTGIRCVSIGDLLQRASINSHLIL